jgi:hypothetical protein
MILPLNFLDVNCCIGPYYNPAPGHDWSAIGLLAKMDELGIAEACPAAVLGRDYDPREGNAWLSANLPGSPRLHPVWTVGNHHSGEFPPPDELLAQMREHGVRMLRLFLYPTAFLDRLDLPLLTELFDAMDEHRVPLLVDTSDPLLLRAEDLEPVFKGWPKLPLILSVPKVVQNERWFYYLWERYDSFHLDLSGYQVLGGIKAIVERFGSRRLVYGSRYPFFTPLQSMLQLIYAEVDDTAKRAIAGDTVRGLLREVRL